MIQMMQKWSKEATRVLVGRTITKAEYVEDGGEIRLTLVLDNGSEVDVMRDDEGNGCGSLHVATPTKHIILPGLG